MNQPFSPHFMRALIPNYTGVLPQSRSEEVIAGTYLPNPLSDMPAFSFKAWPAMPTPAFETVLQLIQRNGWDVNPAAQMGALMPLAMAGDDDDLDLDEVDADDDLDDDLDEEDDFEDIEEDIDEEDLAELEEELEDEDFDEDDFDDDDDEDEFDEDAVEADEDF